MPIASSLLKKPRLVKKLKDFYEYVKYNDGKVGTKTRGIDLNFNVGQHGAIFVGLKHAIGDKIIIMDDDLQHPPKSLISIYDQLDQFDACYTHYLKRKHVYWKIIVSSLNNFFSIFSFPRSFNIDDKIVFAIFLSSNWCNKPNIETFVS